MSAAFTMAMATFTVSDINLFAIAIPFTCILYSSYNHLLHKPLSIKSCFYNIKYLSSNYALIHLEIKYKKMAMARLKILFLNIYFYFVPTHYFSVLILLRSLFFIFSLPTLSLLLTFLSYIHSTFYFYISFSSLIAYMNPL